MKSVLWTWTGLCVAILAVTFVGAPAWDTEAEGYEFFSGTAVFTFVAILLGVSWLIGLAILTGIGALLRSLPRDDDGRTWWDRRRAAARMAIVASTIVVLGLGVVSLAGTDGDGDGTGSSFVSFNTVDADPDWAPDGRWIAFVTNRGSGGIYVVRPAGTGMRRVFRGEASDIDWSPDGREIAFTGSHGVYVLPMAGGRPRLVVRGDAFSLPAWAPNGRELAVVKEEPGVFQSYDGPFESTSAAVYSVRLDGSGLGRLLPRFRRAVGDARPGSVAAVSETEPTWSPDGKRIAFQASDGVIVVADVKSGQRVEVNEGWAGYEPAWSPDGRLIAYQCEGDVCVANADGSGGERTIASGGGDPSWSPDSRQVVFERYLYGGTGWGSHPQSLLIVRTNGEDLRTLTYGPGS